MYNSDQFRQPEDLWGDGAMDPRLGTCLMRPECGVCRSSKVFPLPNAGSWLRFSPSFALSRRELIVCQEARS